MTADSDNFERRRRRHALRLNALQAGIKVGLDRLARGEFVEIACRDLDRYLEELKAKARKHRS